MKILPLKATPCSKKLVYFAVIAFDLLARKRAQPDTGGAVYYSLVDVV